MKISNVPISFGPARAVLKIFVVRLAPKIWSPTQDPNGGGWGDMLCHKFSKFLWPGPTTPQILPSPARSIW